MKDLRRRLSTLWYTFDIRIQYRELLKEAPISGITYVLHTYNIRCTVQEASLGSFHLKY